MSFSLPALRVYLRLNTLSYFRIQIQDWHVQVKLEFSTEFSEDATNLMVPVLLDSEVPSNPVHLSPPSHINLLGSPYMYKVTLIFLSYIKSFRARGCIWDEMREILCILHLH